MDKRITPAGFSALFSGNIENFIAASTPGGIEAQEAAGQKQFINSTTLPKQMLHGCTKELLEQMGIVFKDDADDLFVNAELPNGWKKQATDHSMWSDLLDEKGRKRAAIFYKAAFYDQRAHINLTKRFSINYYSEHNCDKGYLRVAAMDGDKIIFETEQYPEKDYNAADLYREIVKNWLDKHYPDWKNPLVYWD